MTEENVLEGYAIVKRLAVGLFAGLAFASAAAPSSADESKQSGLVTAVERPFADPFIYQEGGVYYAYGTDVPDSEGIPVMTSTDLVHWKPDAGRAKGGLALSRDDSFGTKWFWSPYVYKFGNRYVMGYSANERIALAFADSPLGPFRQTEKKPFFDFGAISGTLFWDDDGRVWMFMAKFDGGNVVYQVELEKDLSAAKPGTMRRLFGATAPWELRFPGEFVTEAPSVNKIGGVYVLTYTANNFMDQDYALGMATSKSIDGPWKKYVGNPVMLRYGKYVGTGCNTFFRDANGRWKSVFHSHHSLGQVSPRRMHIVDVEWKTDGGIPVPVFGKEVE